MSKRDYYEVLGASKNASEAELKKAYRRAARLGPDQAGPQVAIARVRLYQGKTKAAGRRLDEALRLDPSDRQALDLLEAIRRLGLY